MFSYEFATSFFKEHLWTTRVNAVYTTEQLFQIISRIDRKTPVIEPFILSLQARRPAILIKKLNQVCFPEKYFRRALLRALIANTGWSFNLLGHIFLNHARYSWAQYLCFHVEFVAVTFSVAMAGCLVLLFDLFFSYWPRFCTWKQITQQSRETSQSE